MIRPFVYIASLRRTGSTVLAEALTALPHSFIFVEPQFGGNRWSIKPGDTELLAPFGVDLDARREQWLAAGRSPHALDVLRKQIMAPLSGRIGQFGVKEIRHEGWRAYHRAFPDMRIVLTARDPRDIYISLYHRQRQGLGTWKGDYTPRRVADDLNTQFAFQMEMHAAGPTLRVRYEDFTADAAQIERIKSFIDSPIPPASVGEIGGFLSRAPGRAEEARLHAGSITTQRTGRWREEPDSRLREEAVSILGLMSEYAAFWGYGAEATGCVRPGAT